MNDTLMEQNFEFKHQSLLPDSGRGYHKGLHQVDAFRVDPR